MTVREAFRAAFRKKKLGAFEALADDMEAYDDCVSDYFHGADVATKQDFASKALEFNVAELPTSAIRESLLPPLRADANVGIQADSRIESRTIDMSFLDRLPCT